MKKYEGYVENMKKYDDEKFRAYLPKGGGESYAYADTIPGMAPSTQKRRRVFRQNKNLSTRV